MSGPIKCVFTIIWFAIGLGIAGNLIEATGIVGREAAKAHIHGGMSFGWWNRQLVGPKSEGKGSNQHFKSSE